MFIGPHNLHGLFVTTTNFILFFHYFQKRIELDFSKILISPLFQSTSGFPLGNCKRNCKFHIGNAKSC